MRTKSFIVLVFTLFGSVHLFGQESRKEICVDFRVGKSTLDTAYVNNAERLAEIVSFLGSVKMMGHSIWSRCPSVVLLHRKGLPESIEGWRKNAVRQWRTMCADVFRFRTVSSPVAMPPSLGNVWPVWRNSRTCLTRRKPWRCCAMSPNTRTMTKGF